MKGTRLELPNEELRKMKKLFWDKAKEINTKGQEGLNTVAMNVAADAKANLKANNSIASGQTINSVFVRQQKDMTTDVTAEAAHSYWIEFGRKAGGMPPIKPILEWIKKKGTADTYNIKTHKQTARGSATSYSNIKTRKTIVVSDFYKRATSLAWAIAKSIAKKGTKARPFLFPAFRKNEADMMRVIGEAIKKVI